MNASINGRENCLKLLIAAGANLDHQDKVVVHECNYIVA